MADGYVVDGFMKEISWNFAPQEGCLKNPGAWDDNFKLYWLAGS